jgi:hypothetical protein
VLINQNADILDLLQQVIKNQQVMTALIGYCVAGFALMLGTIIVFVIWGFITQNIINNIY